MKPYYFIWIDLEMTGLNPRTDVILEVAIIITDGDLNVIARGPEVVLYQTPEILAHMMPIVRDMHTRSGLLKKIQNSTASTEKTEQEVLTFIQKHVPKGVGYLAGNSVWKDRAFLSVHMPSIVEYLHYRLLDVTGFKLAINAWYPETQNKGFKKNDTHRALDDITESIEELKFYKQHFFRKL